MLFYYLWMNLGTAISYCTHIITGKISQGCKVYLLWYKVLSIDSPAVRVWTVHVSRIKIFFVNSRKFAKLNNHENVVLYNISLNSLPLSFFLLPHPTPPSHFPPPAGEEGCDLCQFSPSAPSPPDRCGSSMTLLLTFMSRSTGTTLP